MQKHTRSRWMAASLLGAAWIFISAVNCRAALDIDELQFTADDPGASSGTTMAGGEDCVDGIDNDGDMLADCDDSDCTQADFQCVDTFGATAVIGTLDVKTCVPPLLPTDLRTCENVCTCTPKPGGSACSIKVTLSDMADCSASLATIDISGDTCNTAPNNTIAGQYTQNPNGQGTCTPMNAAEPPTNLPGCRIPLTGHCKEGGVCIPPTQTPECLLFDGIVTCPEIYKVRTEVTGNTSGGNCECNCGAANTNCDTVSVDLFTDNGSCAGTVAPIPVPANTCQSAGVSIQSFRVTFNSQAGTACNTNGTWVGEMAQTLCCRKN